MQRFRAGSEIFERPGAAEFVKLRQIKIAVRGKEAAGQEQERGEKRTSTAPKRRRRSRTAGVKRKG
jgi:hypothetical protein